MGVDSYRNCDNRHTGPYAGVTPLTEFGLASSDIDTRLLIVQSSGGGLLMQSKSASFDYCDGLREFKERGQGVFGSWVVAAIFFGSLVVVPLL